MRCRHGQRGPGVDGLTSRGRACPHALRPDGDADELLDGFAKYSSVGIQPRPEVGLLQPAWTELTNPGLQALGVRQLLLDLGPAPVAQGADEVQAQPAGAGSEALVIWPAPSAAMKPR